jgi:hypothetical protein
MMWAVITDTVAGPGFLAGDYVRASGEASVGAGLGANVLIGGSNRTATLQRVSVSGEIGLNFAVGGASLRLGPPTLMGGPPRRHVTEPRGTEPEHGRPAGG